MKNFIIVSQSVAAVWLFLIASHKNTDWEEGLKKVKYDVCLFLSFILVLLKI